MAYIATILLLGSGELGREFVISAKRLGARVIACDSYDDAPAMQLADAREVFSMLDGEALRDAIASVQVDSRLPVIPVRALKNKGTDELSKKQIEVAALLDREEVAMGEAQLLIEDYWAGALRRAVIDDDVENGSLMAGQSVGMVKAEEPVADIIATLMAECEEALTRR